jgi:hypothetical protein
MRASITLTLDQDTARRFNKEIRARQLNRSAVVRALIETWLDALEQEKGPIIEPQKSRQ